MQLDWLMADLAANTSRVLRGPNARTDDTSSSSAERPRSYFSWTMFGNTPARQLRRLGIYFAVPPKLQPPEVIRRSPWTATAITCSATSSARAAAGATATWKWLVYKTSYLRRDTPSLLSGRPRRSIQTHVWE